MRLGSRSVKASVDEENPYWMSFSDIMSGLLIIFVLASVILILQLMEKKEDYDKTVSQLQQAEQVRRTILQDAAEELKAQGIQVVLNENETVLHIPNHILGFDSGEDEIRPEYREAAFKIGDVIQKLVAKDDRADYLDTVFVEGHTDSKQFWTKECGRDGNWCLSAFRAISLWRFWEENLPDERKLSALNNREGIPLFSVSGYAATRPLVKNEQSSEDYSQNRRIDIRFTIRRPDSKEMQERLTENLGEI